MQGLGAIGDIVREPADGLEDKGFPPPKVIRMNSNRPKGVVIAVLGMSPGFMGIWWYPCMGIHLF